MSHLKYSRLRFPKADKAVPQLMTFALVHNKKHGSQGHGQNASLFCIVINLQCFTATEMYLLIKTYETVKKLFHLILQTVLIILLINYGWLHPVAF